VRRRPYSVVLLDEVEKAHPEAFNMLLQVMEDGYLSDAKGRRVDFRNTLILMTSNIGAKLIQGANKMGFAITNEEEAKREQEYESMKGKVMDALKKTFRPAASPSRRSPRSSRSSCALCVCKWPNRT
jgi:ATP-dependent Clp protease ATP-binding subunit ClpC